MPQARGVDHAEHCVLILGTKVFPVGAVVQNPPASAGDARDMGSIPESGRSSEEGNGNPLQYSCLENPTDRGTWQATVHGSQRVRHT